MPYIDEASRGQYDREINKLVRSLSQLGWPEGHVNYIIYRLLKAGFERSPSYTAANKFLGVLSAVSKEFYRRLAAPYEDEKMALNGDIE